MVEERHAVHHELSQHHETVYNMLIESNKPVNGYVYRGQDIYNSISACVPCNPPVTASISTKYFGNEPMYKRAEHMVCHKGRCAYLHITKKIEKKLFANFRMFSIQGI